MTEYQFLGAHGTLWPFGHGIELYLNAKCEIPGGIERMTTLGLTTATLLK